MKVTNVRCDFCGQPHKHMGTLTVPMTKEEAELKKRCSSKPAAPDPIQVSYGLFFGVGGEESAKSVSYDICHGCAVGIVKARMASIVKLRAAMATEEV